MLVYVLTFALSAVGRQPAPLSPASLPPPPVAARPVPPDAKPVEPGFHTAVGGWPTTEPADAILRKAVAALTGSGKCVFAEVAGGKASGYRNKCRVTVFAAHGLGFVVVASRDKIEAELLVKQLVDDIDDMKTVPDAKSAGKRDAKVEATIPGFDYHVEARPATAVALKYLPPTAALLLEKRGFVLQPNESAMLVGGVKPHKADPNAQYVAVWCVCLDPKVVVYVTFGTWGETPPADTPAAMSKALLRIFHE